MPSLPRFRIAMLLATCVLQLCACNNSNDSSPETGYLPVAPARVELPPDAGSPFLATTVSFDLAEVGYQQHEYFLAGTATAFTNSNELSADGRWEVEPGATAGYKTRIVAYTPVNPDAFSGTVFVEWLNVSAGFESQPVWGAGHTELLRAGHAWVGVSAQVGGIEGSANSLLPFNLKAVNPERYGSLSHPGDSFSYDIFSQVAGALREPDEFDLLQGLVPRQIIAMGQSQSASRMLTYANAMHPVHNAYDGYLVQSRYFGSAPLSQAPQVQIDTPGAVGLRTDLNVPVLNVQSETDVIGLGAIDSRQADTTRFRLWEVAGTSHSDYYGNVSGRADRGSDPAFALVVEEASVAGIINCERPMNAGPMPWVVNAALSAMHHWVLNGAAPARAGRLATSDDKTLFRTDSNGNAKGGVRTPYVDAPAAKLSGEINEGESFCRLFGTTDLLDAAAMASLYVDQTGYVAAVGEATDRAVAKGFLLAADGARIKAAASLQWDQLVN